MERELETLKEQLKKQEKLASLGMLSAGIAHEIQNPLNFVINFSKMSDKLLNDLTDIMEDNQELLPADENKCRDLSLGDHPGRENGLPERRPCGKDAGIMFGKFLGRYPLLIPQFANKAKAFYLAAFHPLVGDVPLRPFVTDCLQRSIKTSTREDKVVVAVHAAVYHPRCVVDVQP